MRIRMIALELFGFVIKICTSCNNNEQNAEKVKLFKDFHSTKFKVAYVLICLMNHLESIQNPELNMDYFRRINSKSFNDFNEKLSELCLLKLNHETPQNEENFKIISKEACLKWDAAIKEGICCLTKNVCFLKDNFGRLNASIREFSEFFENYIKIKNEIILKFLIESQDEIITKEKENKLNLVKIKIEDSHREIFRLKFIINNYLALSETLKICAIEIYRFLETLKSQNITHFNLKWNKKNFEMVFLKFLSLFEKETEIVFLSLKKTGEAINTMFSELELSCLLSDNDVQPFLSSFPDNEIKYFKCENSPDRCDLAKLFKGSPVFHVYCFFLKSSTDPNNTFSEANAF